jgi:hypothetical protein
MLQSFLFGKSMVDPDSFTLHMILLLQTVIYIKDYGGLVALFPSLPFTSSILQLLQVVSRPYFIISFFQNI